MTNIDSIRNQFPIFNLKVNKQDLIYLDNGATTQKPESVIVAEKDYYEKINSNVHRGVHYLSRMATKKVEETRSIVQKFINAKSSLEVITTKGTTDSINLIAHGFRSILKKDDEIILSEMEHHSNIVPWQMCCEITGAKIKVAPIMESGELDLAQFKGMLNKKTKLVAITHISNALGIINPIKKIIELTHDAGAKILIDGAQAASHLKIDVQQLNVDFYCFSAHKMYGPTGVGILYGKEALLNSISPYQGGGEMIKEVTFKNTTYAGLPHKFEAGTPNIAGLIAFKYAIDFIETIGLNNIREHENQLLNYATSEILKIKGVKIFGISKNKSGIISFNIDNIHAYDLGMILDKMGVAIRTGHHCAQPVMEKYNILGTARLSFAVYNTQKEIDLCIKAIKKAKLMLS